MTILRNSEIQTIKENKGTNIKQYFHPHDTLNGISYSIAHFTLEPGKKSKLHKLTSSEIYHILEGNGMFIMDKEEFEVKKVIQYMLHKILNSKFVILAPKF